MAGWVALFHYLLAVIVCFASLLVFQGGFLLKRVQLVHKSKCEDVSFSSNACWVPARFDRAVIVMIDALRYDFVAAEAEGGKPWQGNMPFTKSLAERGAFLTKALADPPTTTLQRLKALGTGGLPTFIDASENFSSDAEVEEDSLLAQLREAGKNATLLGDDTWLSLYPNGFTRTFALPSFDIHDLHTVDNYVLEHLDSELSRPDWSLLVAHFLGVDHAGHKYGPAHPEMAAKLRHMDKVVMQVANSLKPRTLLIVMGDHGMTWTGDHGGDSDDEVGAAFLAYAKGESFGGVSTAAPIQQIDLVPSLSLLLDLPIPFSSLGSVIPALFPARDLARLTALNAMQVERFASTYSSSHGMAGLSSSLPKELPSTVPEQTELIARLQSSLRTAWTRFDEGVMRVSLLTLLDALLSLLLPPSLPSFIIRHCHLLLLLTIRLSSATDPSTSATASSLLHCSLALSLFYAASRLIPSAFSALSSIPTLSLLAHSAILLHGLSFLSNSYVVYEQSCLRFLLSSLLLASAASRLLSPSASSPSSLSRLRSLSPFSLPSLHFLACLLLLRIDPLFHRCREEEPECVQFSAALPSASLSPDSLSLRLLLGCASAALSIFLLRRSSPSPPSSRPSLLRLADSLSLPSLVILLLYYCTSLLPPDHATRYQSAIRLLAQTVYLLSAVSLFLCLLSSHSTASLSSLLLPLSLPILLLLGEGLSPAFLIFLFLLLSLPRFFPPSLLVPLLSLLLPYSFYLLGHSPTLPAIPWPAAFVGLSGASAPRILAASLVLSHLFAGVLLIGFSLPLLLLSGGGSAPFSSSLSPFVHLSLTAGVRVVASCTAAIVHRRHLMVWKIFAPHFIFSGISFLVLLAVLTLSLLLSRRMQLLT